MRGWGLMGGAGLKRDGAKGGSVREREEPNEGAGTERGGGARA